MTKVLRYSAALLFVTALSLLVGGSAAAQSTNNPRYRQFRDTAAASITTPAAGNVRLFFDSTGFYWKNSAGVSTALGGSGITGLTEAVVPAVAAGGSSLEDSKMTTSGGSKGTWTLYDTGGTAVSQLFVRSGANQSTTPLLRLGGTTANTGFAIIASTSTNGTTFKTGDSGQFANVILKSVRASNDGYYLQDSGTVGFLSLGDDGYLQWTSGDAFNGTPDLGLARSAAGILAVTDGSTGQGGIGIADSATNTVSDALILRHATSGTAAASFGTGLLFQGESDVSGNSDMVQLQAVWQTAPDATRDSELKIYATRDGSLVHTATITPNKGLGGNPGLLFPGSGYVYSGGSLTIESTSDLLLQTADVSIRWIVRSATGNLEPAVTNSWDIGSSSLFVRSAYVSTSIQGTRTQAISDNAAAATFVTIAVPTSDTTVGGRIFYTITAIDAGTAIQTKTGTYSFGLNNIGGTVTGAGTDVLEHSQLSSGTLAPTFSVNISGTNAQFQLVLDTSLDAAAETLKIEYRVQIDSGTATVTPAT